MRDRDPGKRRVILTEHSEVNSESRRKPAVSNARAAAALNTPPPFVAVALEHRGAASLRVTARAILLAGR